MTAERDMQSTPEYKELQTAFHRLWTKYVGTDDYDKSEWKRLNDAIEQAISRACGVGDE